MSDRGGIVYDLGYVPHDGTRLGRGGAIRAMMFDGMRRVMGIRRKGRRKIFPWIMVGIAFLPSIVFVGLAFFVNNFVPDGESPFGSHADYYALAGVPTFIFVALAAPELLIPDRVQGVLSVYSSRPISPRDYVLARLGTLGILVTAFTLLPQLLMYIGFASLDADGFLAGLSSNAAELWKMLAVSSALFAAWGATGFLISVFTNRTTTARVLFLGGLVGSSGLAAALAESGSFGTARYAALVSVLDHPINVLGWVYGTRVDTVPGTAGFGPGVSLTVILGLVALAAVVPIVRYRRLM